MNLLRASAVLLTALALIPGGAQVFELPNKLELPEQQYFIVQQIYRGWALLGGVIFVALAVNAALAFLLWRRRESFGWPLLASAAIAASLVVFFVWVYPGNVATENWTVVPADWQALRTRWEFGHAAAALLILIALCATAFTRTGSDHALGAQRRDL